ncbi:MAG: hypothetical protein OZ948_06635 [Deltaproteobacteria bacterium]|nr:hypothetical protein [Deltaproteobacteria bacterium]
MSGWLERVLARWRSAPPSFAAVLGRALGDEEYATLRLAALARTLSEAPEVGSVPRVRPPLPESSVSPRAALAARMSKE